MRRKSNFDNYLFELGQCLNARVPRDYASDSLSEIRAHLEESAEDIALFDSECQDPYAKATNIFGSPQLVASKYISNYWRDHSPWRLGRDVMAVAAIAVFVPAIILIESPRSTANETFFWFVMAMIFPLVLAGRRLASTGIPQMMLGGAIGALAACYLLYTQSAISVAPNGVRFPSWKLTRDLTQSYELESVLAKVWDQQMFGGYNCFALQSASKAPFFRKQYHSGSVWFVPSPEMLSPGYDFHQGIHFKTVDSEARANSIWLSPTATEMILKANKDFLDNQSSLEWIDDQVGAPMDRLDEIVRDYATKSGQLFFGYGLVLFIAAKLRAARLRPLPVTSLDETPGR